MKFFGFILAIMAIIFAAVSGMSVKAGTAGLREMKPAGCNGGPPGGPGGPPPGPPPSNTTS